jgi:hypothetical protein
VCPFGDNRMEERSRTSVQRWLTSMDGSRTEKRKSPGHLSRSLVKNFTFLKRRVRGSAEGRRADAGR